MISRKIRELKILISRETFESEILISLGICESKILISREIRESKIRVSRLGGKIVSRDLPVSFQEFFRELKDDGKNSKKYEFLESELKIFVGPREIPGRISK